MVGKGSLGIYDPNAMRTEAAYLRLISIVEAYIDSMCSQLILSTNDQSEMFRLLVSTAEERASSSWREREEAFRTYHNISLSKCDAWKELQSGIVIRNAIAHGLGHLTKRQRKPATRLKVQSIGARLSDDQLILDAQCLDQALAFSRIFVESVDDKISAR